VRQSLLEADRAFNRATQESGADGWVSSFDAGGGMIQAGTGEIQGLEAIREAMEGMLSPPGVSLTWDPIRAHASADGTLGFTVGEYEVTSPGEDGQPAVSHGLYVSIWRRQADGSWKVMMDLGNPTG
jgi:ketosteroid isomerase-like protein